MDTTHAPLPMFLTTLELAVYLRYTGKRGQAAAQKFIQRNGIRRSWRGRCVLVRRADVDAVIEGRKRTDGKAA